MLQRLNPEYDSDFYLTIFSMILNGFDRAAVKK